MTSQPTRISPTMHRYASDDVTGYCAVCGFPAHCHVPASSSRDAGVTLPHARERSELRRVLDEQMDEKTWQKQVTDALDWHAWSWYHVRISDESKPGFPDVEAWHAQHGSLWIECKTERGSLDTDQASMIASMLEAGRRVYVLRPRDVAILDVITQGGAYPSVDLSRERIVQARKRGKQKGNPDGRSPVVPRAGRRRTRA